MHALLDRYQLCDGKSRGDIAATLDMAQLLVTNGADMNSVDMDDAHAIGVGVHVRCPNSVLDAVRIAQQFDDVFLHLTMRTLHLPSRLSFNAYQVEIGDAELLR